MKAMKLPTNWPKWQLCEIRTCYLKKIKMTPEPPSLFELCCTQAPVHSPTSRAVMDEAARRGFMDTGTMEIVNESELAHLYCRGRVPVEMQRGSRYGLVMDPLQYPKAQGRDPGIIDDAKLANFHPDTGTVIVRLDTWQNSAFWAECHIPLDKLQQWLLEQGVEMNWKLV